MPLLAVSDPSKLPWGTNVGLRRDSEAFQEWIEFQTPYFYRPIIHNRVVVRHTITRFDDESDAPTAIAEPIPLFVAEALAEKAKTAAEVCPISLEPLNSLQKGEIAVTSCFHLFQKQALESWHSEKKSCPVCKKSCAVTHC